MRKLFFALAFVLIGSFAFANNSVETTKIDIEEVKKTEKFSVYKVNVIDEDGTCTIYHWVYFNGRYIGSFTIEAPDTHEDCGGSVFHIHN